MTTRTVELAKLYEAESDRLRAFVRRVVGNSAIADDVVQQAFANLLGKSAEQAPANAAYVTQAARNLAFNHIRDARRRSEIEIPDAHLERLADSRPSPEMTVLYRNELNRLLEAMAALPPRRREAFVLSKIEGLSYAEIAARMDISRNTVISYIVAAMTELDRRLARNNIQE